MGRITFQQGVALAMGAYIDPANTTNNKRFVLVCEGGDTGFNYTGNGITEFRKIPGNVYNTGQVSHRLRALFHGINAGETDMSALDFAALPIPTLGTSGNMVDQVFFQWKSTSTGPSGSGLYKGGDVDGDGTFETAEANLHRTGLAIWNKLKK